MLTNYQVFQKIANEISIGSNGQIFLKKKPILSKFLFQEFYGNYTLKKELIVSELTDLIYTNYYCEFESFSGKLKNNINHLKGIGKKFKINKSIYSVEYVGINKNLVVSNKFERICVEPGGYYLFGDANVKVNAKVMVTKIRFHYDLALNFAYFSNHHFTMGNFFSKEIRLYINLMATGVVNLLPILLEKISKSKINFKLKTCIERSDFYRPDNTVLYVDVKDFETAQKLLLESNYQQEKSLGIGTPIFTKKIINGISWAESLYNKKESFGMNSSKLVANFLFEKTFKNLTLEKYLAESIDDIESLHLFRQ